MTIRRLSRRQLDAHDRQTKEQQAADTLRAVAWFLGTEGHCPTLGDLAEIMGITSSGARYRVVAAAALGLVTWTPNTHRTIRPTMPTRAAARLARQLEAGPPDDPHAQTFDNPNTKDTP